MNFNQQFNLGHAQSQKKNDDKRIEVLKQRVFDGKLSIKNDTLRDLSFIENLNVQILDLSRCNIIPKFTCQTMKELRIDQINIENFKNINLENLETLKISKSHLNECEYFSKVIELELHHVQNVEYLFSKQICKTIKELRVINCSIKSLNSIHLENVKVLYIQGYNPFANNPNILNIENIQTYQHLRDLCLVLQNDIDTTPLQQLTNLSTVKFKQCNNLIINLKSERIKDLLLNSCILKSVNSFQLPNMQILGISYFSAVNMDNINQFQNLKELDLSGSQGLDLSQLQDLTQITSLNLSGCDIRDTTDMSEQAIQKLKNIKINPQEVKENCYIDASPLKFLVQLEKLNMNNCKLNKIDVLRYLINLKELDLADNDNIDDITPIGNLLQLRILNLEHCCLTNIEALQLLLNLEELNLANNVNIFSDKVIQRTGYLDTAPLQYLTKLTILNLNSCAKLQMSSLSKLTNLDRLYLSSNSIQDLRALQQLHLKQLYLSSTEFDNIDALQYLLGLAILDLSKCQLSCINALKTLVNLEELNLSRDLSQYEVEQIKNPIFDITPLQYLTQLEKLEIKQCGLQSVEALIPLQKLKVLDLNNNLIVYAKPLVQLKQLVDLEISSNKIIDFSSQFVKFFDQDSIVVKYSKQPTEQEIQYANILRDVNSPVSLPRNMCKRRKQFKNIVVGKKNIVNIRLNQYITNMNSFFGKVITLFQQLNAENIQ
ncbi:leucine-rich_repeat domain-containing protein [Hexamita inflata]|uniref:Leucine-rich repeat domain-containing protein n=1 Tax=Hexamita inflata TaxID=28002 RepID=A0AA86P636_9EUKA|nr:leucine-rich repeat domain-containing protein [Hexamita inflata]